jgi:hypothetical protein
MDLVLKAVGYLLAASAGFSIINYPEMVQPELLALQNIVLI